VSKLVNKIAQILVVSLIVLFAGQSHATKYTIKAVIQDNSYGFQTSLLHSATVERNRSGSILDWLTSAKGTYDSHSGLLDVWFGTSKGGSVHLNGIFKYNDDGYLYGANGAGFATVKTSLTYEGHRVAGTYDFRFPNGSQCNCGPYRPNTLKPHEHGLLLTLWGYGILDHRIDGKKRVLGTDIRLKLAEVPLPGALLFFGTALAGLIGLRRRAQA